MASPLFVEEKIVGNVELNLDAKALEQARENHTAAKLDLLAESELTRMRF